MKESHEAEIPHNFELIEGGFTPTETEELVLSTINKWMDILGLGQWRLAVDLNWLHESVPCRISCEWAYLHAHLFINIKLFDNMPFQILEETIVHELIHIMLAEMRTDEDEDLHEERTATLIARSFIRLQHELESEQSRNNSDNIESNKESSEKKHNSLDKKATG